MINLRKISMFCDVPEAELCPLVQNGFARSLPTASYLCRENDGADFWWLLLEGELELLRHGTDGEERIFGYVNALGLAAPVLTFASHGKTPVGYRARKPSLVLQMRRIDLRRLCMKIPQVALALLEMASDNLCRKFEEIEFLASGSAAQRLSAWLIKQYEKQGNRVTLPMNQRQLAATLGIRPETLNRLFSEWREQGLLEGKRSCWTIAHPKALAALRA